ncbi:MFS transporter [Streptomyces naphthomycinicus]|uniref:MFS transporter n=1 Tax=Streptomyces naphthomycinicus TaxID=2872625 RepID=UPI001CEC3133|nr:MFS transporter [Streptomyces sp. TML10]
MSHHTGTAAGRGSASAVPRSPIAPDPLPYRWVVLGIATFTQAASCFFVQGIGAMAVPLQHALHLDTARLGLLLSASQLVPLAGLLVAGELLDRYNERWVVGIGAGVVALGLLGGSLAQGYSSLLLVLLVVGAGYSTAQPGGAKSVAAWFDPSRRGLAMGIRQAGLPLGGALAAAVLPALAASYGWRAALLTGGLVALTGAGLFTALYRRPPVLATPPVLGAPLVLAAPTAPDRSPSASAAPCASDRSPSAPAVPDRSPADALPAPDRSPSDALPAPDRSPADALPVPDRSPADAPCAPSAPLADRLRMLREPSLAKALLSGMSMVSVHGGVGVLGALFLHDETRLATGPAAAVLVAAQVAGMLGRIVLAAWSDRSRAGRYRPVLTAMVAAVAGLTALTTPLGHSPVAAAVLFVWLGFFGIGWYGPWIAHLAEAAPPGRTGFALGLVMAVNQIAVILVPPALGLLRDTTHSFTPAWAALAAVTAAAAAVTARSDRGRRARTAP